MLFPTDIIAQSQDYWPSSTPQQFRFRRLASATGELAGVMRWVRGAPRCYKITSATQTAPPHCGQLVHYYLRNCMGKAAQTRRVYLLQVETICLQLILVLLLIYLLLFLSLQGSEAQWLLRAETKRRTCRASSR